MTELMIALGLAAMLASASSDKQDISTAPPPMAAQVPPPEGVTSKPRLVSGYISDADYPPEAQRAGESGTTAVEFQISDKGIVTDCTVTQSSGSIALDQTTCALIMARFRYEPAKGANGKAVAQSHSQRITWRLPSGSLPPHVAQMIPMDIDLELVAAPDGSVKSCRVLSLKGPGMEAEKACPEILGGAGFEPFTGDRNKRVRYRWLIEVSDE